MEQGKKQKMKKKGFQNLDRIYTRMPGPSNPGQQRTRLTMYSTLAASPITGGLQLTANYSVNPSGNVYHWSTRAYVFEEYKVVSAELEIYNCGDQSTLSGGALYPAFVWVDEQSSSGPTVADVSAKTTHGFTLGGATASTRPIKTLKWVNRDFTDAEWVGVTTSFTLAYFKVFSDSSYWGLTTSGTAGTNVCLTRLKYVIEFRGLKTI